MPALSPTHSLYAHTDPSFYEFHPHGHYDFLNPQLLHLPPPPPLAHKVWILNCTSCNTFFTNRGMKAVLLLRPHVPLYSTDALPANCSAYTSIPEAPRLAQPADSGRTCECLTQTLCCHGCGNTVGYMIVIPCQHCTSSMSATNRSANGHRFVFHSSEISASERHYIVGEPGVIPFHPPPPPICPTQRGRLNTTIYPTRIPSSVPPIRLSASNSDPHQTFYSDYLPTPPADMSNEERRFDFSLGTSSRASSPPRLPTFGRSQSASPPLPALTPGRAFSPSSHIHFSSPALPLRPPTPTLAKLKPGEVLYWHHLSKHGELPGVEDDERARGSEYTENGYTDVATKDEGCRYEGGIKIRGMTVVCGR